MKFEVAARPPPLQQAAAAASRPSSGQIVVPFEHPHRSLRRCTTGSSAMYAQRDLFAPDRTASPHFVHIQQNGKIVIDPTGNGDLPAFSQQPPAFKPPPSAAANAKPPTRRNSFFGSLFSSSSSKNASSGSLAQQNGGGASPTERPPRDAPWSARTNGHSSAAATNGDGGGGIWMQPKANGHSRDQQQQQKTNGMHGLSLNDSPRHRQRSISTAGASATRLSTTGSLLSAATTVVEHRPSTAREAALETFAVVATKRICVVRKFGSHMDNHITGLLDGLGRNANAEVTYLTVDQQTGAEILGAVQRSGLPLVFINGDCIGGISELRRLYQNGALGEALKPHDYDLIVVGGGSGGIAAAKEAAALGKRVACVNHLAPADGAASATCWNVGRMPKKLMQQASQVGLLLKNASKFGWSLGETTPSFDWSHIRDAVRQQVADENSRNEAELRATHVDYINAVGAFSGSHELTIKTDDGKERRLTADRFMIAVGLRARLPQFPKAAECCIGSDDLFSLTYNPGRTLCIGDSFVSLEIASFLASLGNEVTVLLRGARIRGFDEDVAERIQKHLCASGVRFLTGVITGFRRESEPTDEQPGVVIVNGEQSLADGTTEEFAAEFNTIICASGREPRTAALNLQKVGVKTSTTGKILGRHEQSQTAPHVYAVGDVLEGATEFSQVSPQAARLLMRRLFVGAMERIDYERLLTSALLPAEFCACGFTEVEALQHYGQTGGVEVFEARIEAPDSCMQTPNVSEHSFCKALFLKSENYRLIGFQVLAPHAADIATGFAMAMKLNAHLRDFNDMARVHPSAAEAFSRLQPRSSVVPRASY
ncbi:hypothetical protein M3Y99_00132400 [Aphelenchoides fujianensis]|nr:hypothetical protein M3Y99_00132400 [Aphelenchoides fujianensis]